jgi:putative heme iron utilization protein
MSKAADRATEARRLLRRFRTGVAGTRSVRYEDYPYTAALPYCTDQQGRIVVFVSHLSEHTKGFARDAHVSFTVSPANPDFRPEARLTVLGKISGTDDAAVAERYLRFFPDNRRFLDIGGFRFHSIDPNHVRLIAGFGSAHWIKGSATLAERFPLSDAEQDILDHMNNDHREALEQYCRHVHGIETASAEMAGIDCDGFDVRSNNQIYRFDFDTVVRTASDARAALVALSKAARG